MARQQVNEFLDEISSIENMDDKIAKAEEHFRKVPMLWELLKMAVDPKLKIDLPAGYPSNYIADKGMPAGISDTNIRTEWRRIKNFLPDGSLKVLPSKGRWDSWQTILRGIHWQEAEILTMVKDQNLCEKYPDLWVILPAVGIETCINKGVEKADLPSVETVTVPPVEAAPAKKSKKGK